MVDPNISFSVEVHDARSTDVCTKRPACVLRTIAGSSTAYNISNFREVPEVVSPFADIDVKSPAGTMQGNEAIFPRSTLLTPSSSPNADETMRRNWRTRRSRQPPVEHPSALTTSLTPFSNPSFDGVDRENPFDFEIRPPPLSVRCRLTSETISSPRAMMLTLSRTISDPESIPGIKAHAHEGEDRTSIVHRCWNSVDLQC
ncbi:uncharacterized protein B0H18DRAFT_1120609 [Fomitopsis serialis]|uniref:uncharacterized protein n=1 Tax=Fomitopsis serialis TaxID=139415 RepID=UPI002008DFFB|nr:uncharacterized protein B0H18DRAFT_1120609 [Neoantrodia serialis]KAH9923086.1 hypothetical protein B0H18DRAFT_1120609 [Neoantrodia serialis]